MGDRAIKFYKLQCSNRWKKNSIHYISNSSFVFTNSSSTKRVIVNYFKTRFCWPNLFLGALQVCFWNLYLLMLRATLNHPSPWMRLKRRFGIMTPPKYLVLMMQISSSISKLGRILKMIFSIFLVIFTLDLCFPPPCMLPLSL